MQAVEAKHHRPRVAADIGPQRTFFPCRAECALSGDLNVPMATYRTQTPRYETCEIIGKNYWTRGMYPKITGARFAAGVGALFPQSHHDKRHIDHEQERRREFQNQTTPPVNCSRRH
jgi:hypothetical protein